MKWVQQYSTISNSKEQTPISILIATAYIILRRLGFNLLIVKKGSELIRKGDDIGVCIDCKINYFASYVNQDGCQPCVTGIKCSGGYNTTLKKGYWNLRQYHNLQHNSTYFIKCPSG